MDAIVHKSSRVSRFRPEACRGSLRLMTDVTHTPPALRWVALFLAACAVLGLFLGFHDQIRKNPPGWYTGAEQIATPLPPTADGAREAVAFDPAAGKPASDGDTSATPATVSLTKVEAPVTKPAGSTDAAATSATRSAATSPVTRPRPSASPMPKSQAPTDPVGDILEGQKQTEPPSPAVPY